MTPLIQLGLTAAALLAVAPLPAQGVRPSPIPESELVSRLARTTDSLAGLDRFSGVVMLVKRGTPVFQKAYGMADRDGKRPNTLETAFNLGSINKLFTRIAIRQLVAAGKLDLDATLAASWPGYPNPDIARRVTLTQLLEHTSGIGGSIFAAPSGGTRSQVRHNRDYLPLFVMNPLRFEPGSREEYSNAGYVVLGLLIERVSGEDYYDYVRRHIYDPAGMSRTGHWPVDSLPPNTALGYIRGGADAPESAPLTVNAGMLPGRGSSAGGGYSTAPDLVRLLEALRAGRIPEGPPPGIGVAGGSPGVNATIEGDLPGGYDLIVLANLDPGAAERLGEMVRGWLGVKD